MQGSIRIIGVAESPPDPSQMRDNNFVYADLQARGFDVGDKDPAHTEDKVGIRTRWWSKLTSYQHALIAARNACADADKRTDGQFQRENIRYIGSGGSSSDYLFPACAADMQDKLDIPNRVCEVRDSGGLGCSAWVDALIVAASRMRLKNFRYGLVTGGECVGSSMNAPDSMSYTLWGDGGAAVVLEYDPDGDPHYGILDDVNLCDAGVDERNPNGVHKIDWTRSRKQGLHPCHAQYQYSDASMEGHGKDIQRWGKTYGAQALDEFIGDEPQLPWFIGHSSNLTLVREMGKKAGIPEDRILCCTRDRGNPSSVSVPIELAIRVEDGTIKPGDLVYLYAFGTGMVIAGAKLRWG